MSIFSLGKCFFAVAFLAASIDVWACSCKKDSIEDGFISSDFIFLANVNSAKLVFDGEQRTVEFGISDVIEKKGGMPTFRYVRTPADSSACGMSLLVPGIYWFFTDRHGSFSRCSATTRPDAPEAKDLTGSVWEKIIEQKRSRAEDLERESSGLP